MSEQKTNNWPDEPRLKMIERSEFYGDGARVYQYGFYDGFQYRHQEVKELMEQRDEAVEILKALYLNSRMTMEKRDKINSILNKLNPK